MNDELLQVLRRPPRERADAARNRSRVLEAAGRLFAEGGVAALTVDAVAREAGVGKGTVFRRFGDKSGLVSALLDQRERELQEAVVFGAPPLGPGAPPRERARAFFDAYLTYLADHLDLVRLSETASPGARFRIGAYVFWHRHLALLCADRPDPDHLAHVLLGMVAADLNTELLAQDMGWDRIRAGVASAVDRLVDPSYSP
ncbi:MULTISPECIES: TetR/AcrR family transcriptional regulator [Nocardiopsis]|uniref:TetR family transcriptional regulator n=1 Tax=Nocardiopsis sinuspersici TaxID=501010 RepID=A0A1V3C0T9_9ACTN|nr:MULTISPECIES: TetR/AcrR family transcriptional regulator [Nocardiopsis]OOC54298.1 TetR family transcriptional regulator [Nocardiopsis sinuspersici]